jgi:hypothetical protein
MMDEGERKDSLGDGGRKDRDRKKGMEIREVRRRKRAWARREELRRE